MGSNCTTTTVSTTSPQPLSSPAMAPTISVPVPAPNSWDITDYVVNQGHGVKGLSEMKLPSLPMQFIQPLDERIDASKVVTEESIPVIDMACLDDPKVAELICDAAEKWGFFQIVNHGVPIAVLEDVKEATHRFFALPGSEKRKYSKENSSTNSVRFGTSFTPQAEKSLEWKDYLSLFYVSDDEASTLWPSVCK